MQVSDQKVNASCTSLPEIEGESPNRQMFHTPRGEQMEEHCLQGDVEEISHPISTPQAERCDASSTPFEPPTPQIDVSQVLPGMSFLGDGERRATSSFVGVERVGSEIFRGLTVHDLVQLAFGEQGSEVLWPGEIGQVLQDRRYGSAPFSVQGPRGKRAWFRGESLVPCARRRTKFEKNGDRELRPLIQLVVEALGPTARLDFPKITDICEAAAQNPDGADVAISVMVATLGEQQIKPGDVRNITTDYLKVLTILNEMLYDELVADVLRSTPGLKPALERLMSWRYGDMGDSADENTRMLATEVERRVFEGGRATRPSSRMDIIMLCAHGHLLTWLDRRGWHLRPRACAACHKDLPRSAQRYICQTCYYYDVCVSCARWGAPPQQAQYTEEPATWRGHCFSHGDRGAISWGVPRSTGPPVARFVLEAE